MHYKTILFDLDGTLTDPAPGITHSVMHALGRFGIEVQDEKSLYCFIGPPLRESFARYYGFSPEKAKQAVLYYREYFQDKGLYENRVYDGIKPMLESLQTAEQTLLVATSKPEVYAVRILRYFGLDGYFSFIAGSLLDGTRVDKAEIIAYALENGGVKDRLSAVMVGDRKHDIIGAKTAGISSVGVSFGYGGHGELEAAGADRIADSVQQLSRILMN